MKLQTCTLLFLSDTCLVGRWKVDSHCAPYNILAIMDAVTEAITMAETAYDVLENNYGTDKKVQQMVKYILGDKPSPLGDINKAKGVKQYSKTPYPFLGAPFWGNTDVVLYCDKSNYRPEAPGYVNEVSKVLIVGADQRNLDLCYNPVIPAGVLGLPMAITSRSDLTNMAGYQQAMAAWTAAGSIGPPPDPLLYSFERKDIPNTMNLCTWYLRSLQNEGFAKVDKTTVQNLQKPDFISQLKGDDKAIDTLAQTLGATFLHELSHTNLGGSALDSTKPPGCYGWKCVGALQDVTNADSINILAVALSIWKVGFYVDNDGTIKNL